MNGEDFQNALRIHHLVRFVSGHPGDPHRRHRRNRKARRAAKGAAVIAAPCTVGQGAFFAAALSKISKLLVHLTEFQNRGTTTQLGRKEDEPCRQSELQRGNHLARSAEILPATIEQAAEYMTWFVNRRAYTRQTDRPDEKSGKYFFYQARNRQTKERLALDEQVIRKHLAGVQTIGLYAINPETQ